MAMNFKKYTQIMISILLLFAIVIIVLGIAVWSKNVYTGIIYIVIAGIQFFGIVFLYPRIGRIDDLNEMGNRSVMHNWAVLSVAIAGAALFLAPFFRPDSMIIPFVAFVLCILQVIISALNILFAVKKVKARMIV
jgi:uncharacterized membrane protein YhhN